MANDDAQDSRVQQLERELRKLQEENRQLRAARHRAGRVDWRGWAQAILLVLGLAVLIPASLMVWLNRTVTTPEGYLRAVGPAIEEPAVQRAVQKASTDAILARVDVDQLVAEALPENAQFLAGPISTQVKNYTSTTIGTIVASERFEQLWVEVNQRAQQRFMEIARSSSGSPVVDVSDLYSFVSGQLAGTRLEVLANRELPPRVGEIQVANVPALERIPNFVATLGTWRWILVAMAAGLLAASVWVARDRRRAMIWIGLGWIATTVVTLAMVRIARSSSIDEIADPVYREGALALWRSVLDPFFIQVAVLLVIGLAIAVVGWLLGPGRMAAGLREGSQRYLAQGRRRMLPKADEAAVVQFSQRHRVSLRWGLLALTVLALLLFAPLTVASALTILLVAAVLLVLIEFLAVPDSAASKGT